MEKVKLILFGVVLMGAFLFFQSCDNKDSGETAKERTLRILQSKQQWSAGSVVVPDNSATDADQWESSFTVSFTASNMTTSGHPNGAQAVWPSGGYTVNDDGNQITRADGVVMLLNPINENGFTAIFTIEGKEIGGGRIASLDGEYTFNMAE